MVLLRKEAEDLQQLARACDRFGAALRALANTNPPADRAATGHPEIRRLARELEGAARIVEKAIAAKFMTAAQYGRIARHFEAIAEAMEGGAIKELAAEKRRSPGGRGKAGPKSRKPPPRRR